MASWARQPVLFVQPIYPIQSTNLPCDDSLKECLSRSSMMQGTIRPSSWSRRFFFLHSTFMRRTRAGKPRFGGNGTNLKFRIGLTDLNAENTVCFLDCARPTVENGTIIRALGPTKRRPFRALLNKFWLVGMTVNVSAPNFG